MGVIDEWLQNEAAPIRVAEADYERARELIEGDGVAKLSLGVVDQTIYCHHPTKESAAFHVRYLKEQGFESKIEPDGDRWLVTARRDDNEDDAYLVERLEVFRED
jgi:hypothetical protein